jgi:endogenous inhibitor of DNA gyrase (YacG/DUF329 family)
MEMDKIVNGTVYKKARFLRTTCKTCGKQLTKDLINNNYSWCNKKCRAIWISRNNRKVKKEGKGEK